MFHRDVLIIGAGILGLSSAYHIKKTNPNLKILVIDQFSGPAQGNTAKCAGGYRNMLTTETNYKLSESTIKWFKELQKNQNFNLGFYNVGYLYLLSKPEYQKRKEAFNIMQKNDVKLEFHEKDDLKRKVPDLQIDQDDEAVQMGLKPIEIGVQGVNCGIIHADALAKAYETSEIKGADTSKGKIEATTTIVATGVWAGRLLDAVGVDSYMRPKKRMIFVFDHTNLRKLINAQGFNDYGKLPLLQLPDAKVYIKADLQENNIWVAETEDLGRKYGLEDDPQADERVYTENVYYGLVKYFPCFKDVRPINMWAGQRAINSVDKQPVVVPTPGMIYVGAATGNGILKSDALGRTVAALHNGESEAELFDGKKIRVSGLGIKNRKVGIERF
jgi:glycine/D-amino acid oxidase-like deaminating enzyme